MMDETALLKTANKVKVGPQFIANSKNFIVMQYLDGKKIYDWINSLEGKNSAAKIKAVIRKVLQDCYRLDRLGLDHGELSNITKHVIVGKSTTIIDFESSSLERKVSNVTSATQAMLIGSGIAKTVRQTYNAPTKKSIIKVLREYKKNQTQKNFERVLEVLRL
jgi:putative serine/threonine protein kinase